MDSVCYSDTERLVGKVSCEEVKDKKIFLDSIYISIRDDAYRLAEKNRIKDFPCYWYSVKFKVEERFNYQLCEDCNCRFVHSSKSYFAYEFKFYIIRNKSLPLMYPFYSGYNYCGDELLSEYPPYLFRD